MIVLQYITDVGNVGVNQLTSQYQEIKYKINCVIYNDDDIIYSLGIPSSSTEIFYYVALGQNIMNSK